MTGQREGDMVAPSSGGGVNCVRMMMVSSSHQPAASHEEQTEALPDFNKNYDMNDYVIIIVNNVSMGMLLFC